MVLKFEFPDTGEGVTEGKFLEWLVDEGEYIEEDQTVAEVETDKAVVDVPAPSDGKIRDLKARPGDNVKVGEVIMEIEIDEGEKDSEDEEKESDETGENEDNSEMLEMENSVEKTDSGRKEDVLALPKVRRLAEEKNVDLSSIKIGERVKEEEVIEAAEGDNLEKNKQEKEVNSEDGSSETEQRRETSGTVEATPSVRKLAREKEVEIQDIKGSGRNGKITRDDVLNSVQRSGDKEVQDKEEKKPSEIKGDKRELNPIETRISDRMKESYDKAAHVTHIDKADVTELVKLREEKKDSVDVHLTYLPFIMKASTVALKDYPELNAEINEKNDELILHDSYDINVAVDTDEGLMVPLLEKVDEKTIVEVAEELGDKAGAAKQGELSASEMENGTFSVTNLGVIGGEAFTPIINYPQAAILGIGKIQDTAEVVDGEVVPRKTLKLSLSYDHRIIDGATVARFMNTVIENLEDPEHMLLEL